MINEKLVLVALESWERLNEVIPEMNEDEVYAALITEKRYSCRKQLLLRLHRRFCTLRMKRERAALMELVK